MYLHTCCSSYDRWSCIAHHIGLVVPGCTVTPADPIQRITSTAPVKKNPEYNYPQGKSICQTASTRYSCMIDIDNSWLSDFMTSPL